MQTKVTPNIENVGLENLSNLRFTKRGAIQVDDHSRCVVYNNIGGVGDVNVLGGLVSVAELEARHCVEK